jgi:predicted dehydrogenase
MNKRRVRWGLLSTARINERLIPVLRASPRSEVAAIASRDLAVADHYARAWNIPRAHGSYEALLADPEIDAVYLPLPNHLHAEWAVKCAQAGKHVLCEKPLALTVEEVDRMAEAAERSGVVIQEASMMRFHAQTRYMRQMVARGAIGSVRLLRGIFTFTLERREDIRWDPARGGGSLWDLGSYCVSFARSVLGAEPVEVFAMQVPSASGVDTSLAGQMRFPGDALVQFFSSFAAFAHVEADLLGTAGRILLDVPWVNHVDRSTHVTVIRFGQGQARSTFGDNLDNQTAETQTFENANAYRDEVDSMVATILDGTPPALPLADSRKNVAAILALYTSAREGRPVRL